MSQTYKTEGVILKRWDYKEQDRMMRILTPDYGKITTRAISARKIQSKLAGHLEPFIYSDFHIARSKTIDIIAGSVIISPHTRLRTVVQHSAAASFFADIVDRFTQEEYEEPELFHHVLLYYHWLNENESNLLALYAAIIQFFAIAGYTMELYDCHVCKRPITEQGTKFYYELWNVECERCSTPEETMPMSPELIKMVRFMLENAFPTVTKLSISTTSWQEFHQFIHSVVRYHHEKNIPSENSFLQILQFA